MVVDASAMIAWLINEPAFTPDDNIYHRLATETMIVPAHWPIEVTNALSMNLRRGRLPAQDLAALHQRLRLVSIAVAPPPTIEGIMAVLEFTSAHGLTAYDAAYVMLARDSELPLVTLDAEMRAAAQRLNIPLLPP